MADRPHEPQVEYLTPQPMPRDFAPRRLARRAALAIGLFAVLGAIA